MRFDAQRDNVLAFYRHAALGRVPDLAVQSPNGL